ncbi:hypothetical protein [Vallitalea maricola]|uniref:Uncharacterized protein n=1 Tax=Vallitalea maricola TaxID=3074433 RepID=A0ACB5URP8_9FIRM|nr:hypothetical protein AN2V17_45140 [Vallitalea sp. AN17-2]
MKRKLSLLLVLVFILSSSGMAYAKNAPSSKVNDELMVYMEKGMAIKTFSNPTTDVYTVTITDTDELAKYDNSDEGKLVSRTLTYVMPKEDKNVPLMIRRSSDRGEITIENWKKETNRAYDKTDGTPYRVYGKVTDFKLKATTTSYWEVYGEGSMDVLDVIELKIGGKNGESNVKEWEVHVTVPENHYRDIEVWEYLDKYTYDIHYPKEGYNEGTAYAPNGGLRITNDLYEE